MPDKLSISEMSAEELIVRFQADIVDGTQLLVARFACSEAQKEVVRRGKDVLQQLVDHLNSSPPDNGMELKRAWGLLLANIEANIDPLKMGPKHLEDTVGWIAWAENILSGSEID